MPKIKEFNIENYSKYDINEFVKKNLKEKAEKLAKEVSFFGIKFTGSISTCNYYACVISDEEIELLKIDIKFIKKLKEHHEKEKNKKVEKFNKLKLKTDYCLSDVKPYQKLLKILDEVTYCIAIDELEKIEKTYLKSNSSSKALYRSRASEYNKIECK